MTSKFGGGGRGEVVGGGGGGGGRGVGGNQEYFVMTTPTSQMACYNSSANRRDILICKHLIRVLLDHYLLHCIMHHRCRPAIIYANLLLH